MGMWLVTTIGLALCLGFVGGIMIYALKGALDSTDAKKVDPLPKKPD